MPYQTVYRPLTHPHFVRQWFATHGLGAADDDQLELWDVDWKKLEALGPEIYGAALLGPIQGAMMGMDSETVDAIIRIYLQTYGVLEMYKGMMGIWPYDTAKFAVEEAHLMERSMKMYEFFIELIHKYAEARDKLITNMAAGMDISAEDFHKTAMKAGWTQAQVDQALAEGKKLYTITPKKPQAGMGLAALIVLGLILWAATRR